MLLLLVGCGPDSEAPCRPGFALASDDHCYPPPPDPTPPSANDVLAELGPCVPKKAGTDIDLVLACIDGACARDTFETVNDVLGEGVTCELVEGDWFCTWPQKVQALFAVREGDDTVPAKDATTPWMRATVGYAGADPAGLGIGISPGCWVDALGAPTSVEFFDTAGRLEPRQLVWVAYGIEIEDEEGERGAPVPNDAVDELTLFGPPPP